MSDELMRSHIQIVEDFRRGTIQDDVSEDSLSEDNSASTEEQLMSELEGAVAKMRSYMETTGGEYAAGVEDGMQKAADILENLVRRYREGIIFG